MSYLAILLFLLLVFLIVFKSARVIPKQANGIVYRLGRIDKNVKKPGLVFLVPFLDQLKLINMLVQELNTSYQNVITRDNKPLKIKAHVYYQITDPIKTSNVSEVEAALLQLTQTILRSESAKVNHQDFIGEQESFRDNLKECLNHSAKNWGIQVNLLELIEDRLN